MPEQFDAGTLDFGVRYNSQGFREGVKQTEAEAKAHQARLDALAKQGYSNVAATALLKNREQVRAARLASQEQAAVLARARQKDLITEKQFHAARLKLTAETDAKIKKIQTGGVSDTAAKGAGGTSVLGKLGIAAGAAVALNQVKNFAAGTVDAAARAEKSLGMLRAATRAVGIDFDAARIQVKELASDGTLSIDETTRAYSLLVQQGIKANDAFNAIEAGKKLATFRGISGTAAESFLGFVRALNSGEVEVAENLDPSLKSVIKSLGGMEKVSQSTALKQQLLNEVVKRGTALSDDYAQSLGGIGAARTSLSTAFEDLKVTFGEALAPLFISLTRSLKSLIAVTRELPASAKVGALAFGALALALTPLIGPIGLLVAAIGGIAIASKTARAESDALLSETDRALRDIEQRYADAYLKGGAAGADAAAKRQRELNDLLEKQKEILASMPEEYRKIFEQAQRSNVPVAEQIRLIERLRRDIREEAAYDIAIRGGAKQGPLKASAFDLGVLSASLPKGGGGIAKEFIPKSSDFLLNDLERQLAGVKQRFDEFKISAEVFAVAAGPARDAMIELGETLRDQLSAEAIHQAALSIQSFYEDGIEADLNALREETRLRLKEDEDAMRAAEHAQKTFVSRRQQIEEAAQRKELEIRLRYAEQTVQAITQINSAAISALGSNGAGGAFSGAGGLASAGSSALGGFSSGAGAAALGFVGAAAGVLGGIFAFAEGQAAKAERKERERAERIAREKERLFQAELKQIQLRAELSKIALDAEKRALDAAQKRIDIQLRLDNLTARTEAQKLQNELRTQNATAALNLGVAGSRAAGFTSQIVGATQSELELLSRGSAETRSRVLAAIAARQEKARIARETLQGFVKGIDPKKPETIDRAVNFYLDNKALFTAAEQAAFERAFDVRIQQINLQRAFARGEISEQTYFSLANPNALGGLEGGSKPASIAPTKTNLAALTSEFGTAAGFQESQTGRVQAAVEATIAAAEIANQIQTQKFQDRLDEIERQADVAAATGQTFDQSKRELGLARSIATALGLDIENIDLAAGKELTLERKKQFDLMIDLLKKNGEYSKQIADNTSLKQIENLNVIDVASKLLRFGSQNIRLPTIALDGATSRGIELLTNRAQTGGTDKLGSIDDTLKDIRALMTVLVQLQRGTSVVGLEIFLKKLLDEVKRRTAA